MLANTMASDLPADGVVTGIGSVDGRIVCIVANDSTVKAGSSGARTVEKIVRATGYALRHELPIFWFIESAGARITDQVDPRPAARPHLLESDQAVRERSADLLSLRSVGRRPGPTFRPSAM